VIGAGLGGLALALRLQAAGIATTLVEAREAVGGNTWAWQRDGFTFSDGPSAIADPTPLRELWALSGAELADDCNLIELEPTCRFAWPDGASFDLIGDESAQAREIARFAPGDLAGFEDFQRWCEHSLADGIEQMASRRQRGLADLVRTLPLLARHHGWRSAHGLVSHFVRNDKLREALAFAALLSGGNPLRTGAFYLLAHRTPRGLAACWPEGGMGRLTEVLADRFAALGGTLRLHDPVLQIETLGDRAHQIVTQSGWREHFDAVASNADVVHTYRDLLHGTPRGAEMARSLAGKRHSPGLFTVHFGLEGTWPGIPHAMVLFSSRYAELFADIFDHGVLPQDFVLMLNHPSVTDPSLAPPGKSVFSASIPVANLGKLPIDWETVGTLVESRILDEIGRRLIPDLRDRIVTRFHRSPRDAALDLNAHLGSAWSLEPGHMQSGALRPGNRDAKIRNLYLVGAGTHPGAGLAGVLTSARATATTMLESLT
jgi:phytoene desaturase